MLMAQMPTVSLMRRRSSERKQVTFFRNSERQWDLMATESEENDLIHKIIPEDDISLEMISQINVRPTIHWGPVLEGDSNSKEQINTDTEHFDALFARSNGSSSSSPPPALHPRCYSSCSPSTAPIVITNDPSNHFYANSQPLLSSSLSSSPSKQKSSVNNTTPMTSEYLVEAPSRQSTVSSSSSSSARIKRKNFSLTHAAQTFLQASNSQGEQLEPLERSCSYKRPQSLKKYRQKKKEKESPVLTSPRQQSLITPSSNTCISSSRKSIGGGTTGRVSATDLMTTDDPQDQWSNLKSQRSGRIGSLPLDQLQIPTGGDQEIYLVRQFHTTSKGFVNRGDSFKRSFKRSGSNSRRSSFRINANATTDRTPSQERDLNHSSIINKEIRTSNHSLTNNTSAVNLNGIVDSHFIESNLLGSSSIPLHDHDENDIDDEEDDNPLVERVQTEDGLVHDIRVYQVYLLGTSGTGKCSLIRQFKTTEYRGIYDYSSSIDDDPDNTVSIMLDGVESRLHIISMDIDLVKPPFTGDAYVVVYSITDRLSFQGAMQFIKNVREHELIDAQATIKRNVPIILVGNKSDLVRKRSVTKETARHAAFKNNCKFVETSAAINDKVDDLLAGTLKQVRIAEQIHNEQRRRLTILNGSVDTNDSETAAILNSQQSRKSSTVNPPRTPTRSIFARFFSVFRKKPSRLPADVENLNTGVR